MLQGRKLLGKVCKGAEIGVGSPLLADESVSWRSSSESILIKKSYSMVSSSARKIFKLQFSSSFTDATSSFEVSNKPDGLILNIFCNMSVRVGVIVIGCN